MSTPEERLRRLEAEVERKLLERFAALKDEFDRLRVESDQRWAGFLSRFDQDFKGMVPPELVETPAAAGAASGSISVDVARTLDNAGNQVEVLHAFLELARRHASRAALLIARGASLGVWKALGFSDHGGSDDVTRRVALTLAPGGPLAKVMEGTPIELASDNDISRQLGALEATRAVLIPMVVKEKISGALYADCVAEQESGFDAATLGLLTYTTGLVVDRLATRKLKPAPALRDLVAPAPRVRQTEAPLDLTPEPEPPISAEPELELLTTDSTLPPKAPKMPPPLPPPVPEPPRAAPPAPPPLPVAPTESLSLDDSTPKSGFRISRADVLAAASSGPGGAAAPGPSVTPTSALAAALPGVRPSLGARRLAGPLAPAEGDERRDEARRFAKLLVSEIKLYNERAVLDGREHLNIYERLKEDIDRSRQMYEERIPEDVRANSNFFYEELVRILADGRAEALGL